MSTESTAVQNNTNTAQDSKVQSTETPAQAQSTETKVQEQKPATTEQTQVDAKSTETEPIKEIELTLPDGALLSAEQLAEIKAYAKDNGLSQEKAQDLVNKNNQNLMSFKQAQDAEFEKRKSEWVTQVQADKEIGGPEFNRNIEYAKRALDKFASKDLRETLDKTGLGNHPELVKTFFRIGKAMQEDTFVKSGATTSQPKSMEDIFYGNNKQN